MFNTSARALPLVCAVAVVAVALIAGIAAAQSPDAPVVARVTLPDRDAIERFVALGVDMLELRAGDDYFILTNETELRRLQADGWRIVLDEPQTALLRAGASRRPAYGGYRTVTETRTALDLLAAQHPTLTEVFTYGVSWEGRDLFGVRLTNRQLSGTKPVFFLMAAIHPREQATAELAMRFVAHLLEGYGTDGDAIWLLDSQQIVVVPVANPDGRRWAEQGYYQRKNTNMSYGSCPLPPDITSQYGVDLNRNSDFHWGGAGTSTNPCSEIYRGPSAVSEPETLALQNLIASLFADQRGPADTDAAPLTTTGVLLTLHSFSDLVLYPWSWTVTATAPNDADLAQIGGKFASYNGYTAGQPGNVLYNASGTTDDWAYGALGVAAFTFEVGPASGECGGFMPPIACLDGGAGGAFWQRNLPAFLYAARIAAAPYRLSRGPTIEALTVTPSISGALELRALADESGNGGQAIAAAEYWLDAPVPEGAGTPIGALDGAFDAATETAVAALSFHGRRLVGIRAQDASGNWGPSRALWVSAPAPRVWLPLIAR